MKQEIREQLTHYILDKNTIVGYVVPGGFDDTVHLSNSLFEDKQDEEGYTLVGSASNVTFFLRERGFDFNVVSKDEVARDSVNMDGKLILGQQDFQLTFIVDKVGACSNPKFVLNPTNEHKPFEERAETHRHRRFIVGHQHTKGINYPSMTYWSPVDYERAQSRIYREDLQSSVTGRFSKNRPVGKCLDEITYYDQEARVLDTIANKREHICKALQLTSTSQKIAETLGLSTSFFDEDYGDVDDSYRDCSLPRTVKTLRMTQKSFLALKKTSPDVIDLKVFGEGKSYSMHWIPTRPHFKGMSTKHTARPCTESNCKYCEEGNKPNVHYLFDVAYEGKRYILDVDGRTGSHLNCMITGSACINVRLENKSAAVSLFDVHVQWYHYSFNNEAFDLNKAVEYRRYMLTKGLFIRAV